MGIGNFKMVKQGVYRFKADKPEPDIDDRCPLELGRNQRLLSCRNDPVNMSWQRFIGIIGKKVWGSPRLSRSCVISSVLVSHH